MVANAVITLYVRDKENPSQHHFYCDTDMEPENALVALTAAAFRGARINGHDSIASMTEPLAMTDASFSRLAHWKESEPTSYRYELWEQGGHVWVEAFVPRDDASPIDVGKNYDLWETAFRGPWEEFDSWSEGRI